jgi:hypothetical protein
VESSKCPERDASIIASLQAELALLAIRELDLELRIAELEGHRWKGFSLVELEWITNAFVEPDDGTEPDDELPRQANAELERRARAERGADREEDEDIDLR